VPINTNQLQIVATLSLRNEVFMISCPCCSNQVLRHIRSHQIHWFCRHCWLEIPNLDRHQRDLSKPVYTKPHESWGSLETELWANLN